MAQKTINDIGNGNGLLYITELDGTTFVNPGILNDNDGVGKIKADGLNVSPLSGDVNPYGTISVDTITAVGNVNFVYVNSIQQITNVIPFTLGNEAQLAIDIATEINNTVPASGLNYSASVVGTLVTLTPTTQVGSSVNGTWLLVLGSGGLTIPTQDIDYGQDGTELISLKNGRRYWLDADYGSEGCSGTGIALQGDISNAIEITDYVVKRGFESVIPKLTSAINGFFSLDVLKRISNFSIVNLTNGSPSDLKSIPIDTFRTGDRIEVYGGGLAATFKDVATSGGNIKLVDTTEFVTSSYNDSILLTLTTNPIYGSVWQEVSRSTNSNSTGSITTNELADDSVTTDKIIELNVTADKLATDSVTTVKIVDANVTADKLATDSVTTAKIVDGSVLSAKINDGAITEAKLATDSVTADKIVDDTITSTQIDTETSTELVTMQISWDTNRIGDHKIVMAYPCTLVSAYVFADDTIEATDDADVDFKDGLSVSMGTITLSSGTTIGSGGSITPTTNNTFVKGDELVLTTTKSTPGGNAKVSIELLRQ